MLIHYYFRAYIEYFSTKNFYLIHFVLCTNKNDVHLNV